jgi:hypothetical protein
MTDRKPPQMKFNTWIDQQVADAERRGLFDDLPGKGKPLNLKPGAADGDYGAQWVRDYAHREGVPVEEMLPTPLRLRREIERLAQAAGEYRSEAEVREAAADLNRRIVEWRRIPLGPPIHVQLVNADNLVARWRKAAADRAAQPPPAGDAAAGPRQSHQPRPRRPRWWRRGGRAEPLPISRGTNRVKLPRGSVRSRYMSPRHHDNSKKCVAGGWLTFSAVFRAP